MYWIPEESGDVELEEVADELAAEDSRDDQSRFRRHLLRHGHQKFQFTSRHRQPFRFQDPPKRDNL